MHLAIDLGFYKKQNSQNDKYTVNVKHGKMIVLDACLSKGLATQQAFMIWWKNGEAMRLLSVTDTIAQSNRIGIQALTDKTSRE
jgi:hypothetical protein